MTVIETDRPLSAVQDGESQPLTPFRVVLTVLAALLFAIGWAAGLLSVLLGWVWAAVRVGWIDARRRAGV